MLYFDNIIKKYESTYSFNDSLCYIEKLYNEYKTTSLLNSLIIFSWYYFIEGPIDSRKYGEEDTSYSFEVWSKYSDFIIKSNQCEASTMYLCGYALSLYGFLINKDMEDIGKNLINDALKICKDENLKELINAFIIMDCQKKYKPVKLSNGILYSLFNYDSMVGKYFIDLYRRK